MKRVLLGPFNRVEGDLEVSLQIDGSLVRRAEVTTTLYRGFEQILVGRPPLDALVIAPRICGICSVSQSVAAAAALRDLMRLEAAPNGRLCAKIAHAAENMADHLTHFYLFFMPDFARAAYAGRPWYDDVQGRFKAVDGQAAKPVLSVRSQLLHVMGLLAGKWPHSLAFQPGGTTQSLDLGGRMRLLNILAEFKRFLETTLFGAELQTVLSLATADDLYDFVHAAGADGDFARFVRLSLDLGLDSAGCFRGPFLGYGAYDGHFPAGVADTEGSVTPLRIDAITEDLSHAWMRGITVSPTAGESWPEADKQGAYSWAKAPRLGGKAVEVGALARQYIAADPLIRDLVSRSNGSTVFARVVARLLELAKLSTVAENWARNVQIKQPFCVPSPALADGTGVGLVEAARGALGHWIVVKDGKILRYQIIAPTTWNFSPRDEARQPGPLEQALEGLDVGESGAQGPLIQHVVRSFDPCMVCTAH